MKINVYVKMELMTMVQIKLNVKNVIITVKLVIERTIVNLVIHQKDLKRIHLSKTVKKFVYVKMVKDTLQTKIKVNVNLVM